MFDLELLEEYVSQGLLTVNKHPSKDLYIYNYAKHVQYEKLWDEVTMNCRGLVLDGQGNLIARPFPKFFNYEELEGLPYEIPNEEFEVQEKMDGSLGIVFLYDNDIIVCTRGSFTSEQAMFAKEWIDARLDIRRELLNNLNVAKQAYTFLFEIIYPENRIVVDYGDKEELVLLSVIHNKSGLEYNKKLVKWTSDILGVRCAEIYSYDSLDDLFNARKDLTGNEEGFVITYKSGFKFKLKGSEYCKLHRLISNITPKNFWSLMDVKTGKIDIDFLTQLPEEFEDQINEIKDDIETNFKTLKDNTVLFSDKISTFETRKERYINANDLYGTFYAGLIMAHLDKQDMKVNKMIHKMIKPKGT